MFLIFPKQLMFFFIFSGAINFKNSVAIMFLNFQKQLMFFIFSGAINVLIFLGAINVFIFSGAINVSKEINVFYFLGSN